MAPIVEYLIYGHTKVARYLLIDNSLCKRSYSLWYLYCLGPNEDTLVLMENPSGLCGRHISARSLAHKALPTVWLDAKELVKMCKRFQMHPNIPHAPAGEYTALIRP